jgi:hypothetical protein
MQLLQPLQIERNADGGALVLWLCEPFDQRYSFRAALDEVEHALRFGSGTESVYDVPAEQPAEDFIEGSFTWGTRKFDLYYERSLGYMQISSAKVSDVEAMGAVLLVTLSP